nr:DUF4055 domain-containing protein [uncultured Ottowia sp.]
MNISGIATPSTQLAHLSRAWHLADCLIGGTAAMRAAGRAYLPQWPAEDDDAYQWRKDTATLFPAYRRTLAVMAGKPFSRQLTVNEAGAEMQALLDDIDREGSSLHVFAQRLMHEALAFGICGVLVDYTRRPDGVGNIRAQEKAAGMRPYLVFVRHHEILGWRAERVNGRYRLTQLRLLETATIPDGEYGEKTLRRVRLLEPGRWALFEEPAGAHAQWAQIDGGDTVGMPEIPFVPFYGRKRGFMAGEPPLADLAWLNVKHWQSQSDQDTILHVARVPILVVAGAEDGAPLRVGASTAVRLPQGGAMHFVEHSGAAISAGAAALDALEQQMIQTGAELLMKQPGSRTATESSNDAEANKSELLAIVENFEDSLDQCLQLMADWMQTGEGGKVSLFKEFGAGSLSEVSAQLVLSMQGAGLISQETAIREQQRRGLLSPDLDPVAELERVAAEGPALGSVGGKSE